MLWVQEPAIDAGISVSRVGGAAQTKAIKAVAGSLKLGLAQYRELEAFAQFASDLDKSTQDQLTRGGKLVEVLKQPQNSPHSVAQMTTILFAVNNGILDNISNTKIADFKAKWLEYLSSNLKDIESHLNSGEKLDKEGEAKLLNAMETFRDTMF